MGKAKLLLKMPVGITFLENIVKQYLDFNVTEIIIVVNKDGALLIESMKPTFPNQCVIIQNDNPEIGRFHSVALGVEKVTKSFTFIHNIDNPYAEINVLDLLYNNSFNQKVVKPSYKGKSGHPVLISKKVCAKIISKNQNDIRLDEFLKNYNSIRIEVNTKSILTNLNTQRDYIAHFEKH